MEYLTFNQIKEKYGWTTSEGSIKKQIAYAKNRGVIIEKAYKKGSTYFAIIQDINELKCEWKVYPKNPRYLVSDLGYVKNVDGKLAGSLQSTGYFTVTDQTQTPPQYYRVNRMVLETFNPIKNSENMVADHINGIKTDNRLENLRWVTQRQNSLNRDENFAKMNENYQKLIEIYGYDGLNAIFEAILNRN